MYDRERGETMDFGVSEIEADGFDELLSAVDYVGSGSASQEDMGMTDQVFEYLDFLSDSEIKALELAVTGSIDQRSSEGKVWSKINKGVLKHPAIVGTLAAKMGLELDETGEESWKDRGACRGDKRFVKSGVRPKKEKAQLESICAGCPVYEECAAFAGANNLFKGFWAGKQRTDKNN